MIGGLAKFERNGVGPGWLLPGLDGRTIWRWFFPWRKLKKPATKLPYDLNDCDSTQMAVLTNPNGFYHSLDCPTGMFIVRVRLRLERVVVHCPRRQ